MWEAKKPQQRKGVEGIWTRCQPQLPTNQARLANPEGRLPEVGKGMG